MAASPVIRTERLILRLHEATDLAGVLAVWGDPEVVRGLGGRVSSREDCWARILRYAGHWALMGYGFWAVIEAATGRYAGDIGFADFHRDCAPPLGPEPEAGWALATWAQGRGYATEALRAGLQWDDRRFARQLTRCMIDVDNQASVRVAAKCGYALVGEAVYKDTPVRVYERPADPA